MDDDKLYGYPDLRDNDDGEDVTDDPTRWPKPIERRSRRSGRSRR
jgi:hypothetical protein